MMGDESLVQLGGKLRKPTDTIRVFQWLIGYKLQGVVTYKLTETRYFSEEDVRSREVCSCNSVMRPLYVSASTTTVGEYVARRVGSLIGAEHGRQIRHSGGSGGGTGY
jgi:hypothetical protein